jgi:hypothetical protein
MWKAFMFHEEKSGKFEHKSGKAAQPRPRVTIMKMAKP